MGQYPNSTITGFDDPLKVFTMQEAVLDGVTHHARSIMKTHNTSIGIHAPTIRAGVVSLLVLALCYHLVTQHWDLPRTWLFIVSFAVCFVLMISSVVDLLVLAFAVAARLAGIGVGRSVRLFRRIFSHATHAA
jgi:hypothetical protein